MKALMIKDMTDRNFLAVDLQHVLKALGPHVLTSQWRVRDVWATGEAETAFHELSEQNIISGSDLQNLAEHVVQIIDGVFSGFDPEATSPWVIVEAVDSSFYVVRSSDQTALDSIRQHFKQVFDYDQLIS